jgi:hypothetical protein
MKKLLIYLGGVGFVLPIQAEAGPHHGSFRRGYHRGHFARAYYGYHRGYYYPRYGHRFFYPATILITGTKGQDPVSRFRSTSCHMLAVTCFQETNSGDASFVTEA